MLICLSSFPQDDCVIQSWVWIELTCITKAGLTNTNTSSWPVEAQDIWEQEMQAVKCGRTAVMRTQTSLRGRCEPSATRCWNVLHKWDLTYAYWVFTCLSGYMHHILKWFSLLFGVFEFWEPITIFDDRMSQEKKKYPYIDSLVDFLWSRVQLNATS